MAMLWVALELPSLPLQLALRAGACDGPLVIAEGPAQRPLVRCANEAARQAGIREGQPVAAARALAAELRVVPRDPQAEREALERLAAWGGQFTPMSCVDGQGIALEVASTQRLFSGHGELTAAIRRGVRELGFRAAMGVAPTPVAARVLARAQAQGLATRSCLALAELPERLGHLPIFLLDWPQPTLSRLVDLGVVRLRELLALPSDGLARRFGPEVAMGLDRMMGRLADPRAPYVPPPRFRGRIELPAEAESVEALAFALRRMLVEFEGFLRGRGSGVAQLAIHLHHVRHARTRVALEFASPEREAEFILSLARERLGRLALVAPTHAIELSAEALLPYTPREGAWLPGPREQAVGGERLVERLVARLGPERVFGLAVGDDHRPEKGSRPVSGTAKPQKPPGTGCGPRPAWLLQRPIRLVARGEAPTYQGELAIAAGPERIEAGWWDGEEVRRDYFIATNPRGESFWIFREHRDPHAWYLHGVFA